MAALLLFDCNRIQDYVYASPRQLEIRLASRRLEEVTEGIRREAKNRGGIPIGVAAASGKIWFGPNDGDGGDRAREFELWVLREYRAVGIECTAVVVDTAGTFRDAVCRGEQELRAMKDSPDVLRAGVGSPLFVPCESTGTRPAGVVMQIATDERRRLSPVAAEHRQRPGAAALLDWEKRLASELKVKEGGLWSAICADIEELGREIGGDGADRQAAVALVAADVNDAGKAFSLVESMQAYIACSDKLREAMASALGQAACGLPSAAKRPLFPLYVGGDDLLAYVPAKRSLHFARDLCTAFMAATGDMGLTISAGVAIGKQKTPFRQLSEMARGAEAEAKRARRALRSEGERDRCYVAYDVMRGALPSGLAAGEVYPASAGPFTVGPGDGDDPAPPPESLAALLAVLEQLRTQGFPSNKVKSWVDLSAVARATAATEYYASAKNLPQKARAALAEVVRCLTGLTADDANRAAAGRVVPTRQRGKRVECPLVDLATLWDVVGEEVQQ